MALLREAPVISRRSVPADCAAHLLAHGLHPLLARIYAARGIRTAAQLETALKGLAALDRLHEVGRMAQILADAIAARERLLIIADYDSDGATACAVGVRALRAFGATVDYLVPNRFEYGYGLTPEIVDLAYRTKEPNILITVDNGIASLEGVAAANRLGMRVLITDHHLPGAQLPDALCIINPNQPACGFPSKHLAGVGVMFYLMLALRAELRRRGHFAERAPPSPSIPLPGEEGRLESASPLTPHSSREQREPNLGALLDLVALGTVADVVRLDDNNRILVEQGLTRIRGGKTWPGIAALMRVAGRDLARATTYDLGFVLGPRLNAAGRLDDMSVGIECLTTDDAGTAARLAQQLDALNRERRAIESDMHETALEALDKIAASDSYSLCLFDPEWHQGVIGILASRIKERWHRPVIAFARGNGGELKGSGRSINTFHLRDALDLVAKREPGLIRRFGGHAAAAGLTLHENDLERFRRAFEAAAQSLLTPTDLARIVETDGTLNAEELTLASARLLERQVWGQGFPGPTFEDEFTVAEQRVVGVGGQHLRLTLKKGDGVYEAMLFSRSAPVPERIYVIYRLAAHEYDGTFRLQLTIEHCEPR